VQDGVTLTLVPGLAGARMDSNLSGSTGTFTLGSNAGLLRLGSPGNGGVNATFDTGTNGGIIRAGGTTLNLGALAGAAGTRIEAQDGAGPGTDTVSLGGKNVDATFNGVVADGVNAAPRTAAVTKIGTGTQTLAGTNLYSGATTVTAGVLRVTGSVAQSSGVTVNGGVFEAAATQTLTALTVNDGGTALVSPHAGATTTLKTKNLTLAGTGAVDLGTGAMVVDYDPGNSPIAAIKSAIGYGYASGTWKGPGIRSAAAAATAGRGIGYGESSEIVGAAGGTFLGQQVDGDAVLTRFTLLGDTNLDGAVDFIDLAKLAQSYNSPANLWTQGDFNLDGAVDFLDLAAMAQNYNQALPASALAGTSAQFQADVASAFAQVPEPGMLGVMSLGGLGLLARRRKR
jgi:autotransporter-associated beta strand protein